MEVLAPIQEGANRALKPFRDLFGWFGDTLDAKSERDQLREGARPAAPGRSPRSQDAASENEQLKRIVDCTRRRTALDTYKPVTARVYQPLADSWYPTIEINKGSSDGVPSTSP